MGEVHWEKCGDRHCCGGRDILVFHLGSEEATLTDNAKLIEDLGADSLDVVEVVMSFEEKFNIDIPNHLATEFVTVGDAIAFITAHIGRNYMSGVRAGNAPILT